LDSLLLSCRIIGRKIENVIMNYIFEQAKKNSVEIIKTQFIPTEKNSAIKDFLPSCGFQKEGDFWIYHVEKSFESLNFISIEVDDV